MLFTKFLVAAAAFAVAQAVQFTNPTFSTITAGKAFNLTWTGADGPVTLTLKNGPSTALTTVSVIQSGLTGTSYIWNVPSTLTSDTYALEISDSSNVPNYSTQFQLIGGVASTSSASASTSGSSTGSSSMATVTSTTSGNYTMTTSGSSSKTSSGSKTTSSGSSVTGSKTTSATGSSSTTSAPSSASGLSSPLAFVFLALAAILTLN